LPNLSVTGRALPLLVQPGMHLIFLPCPLPHQGGP
jgi:hypothetical protein